MESDTQLPPDLDSEEVDAARIAVLPVASRSDIQNDFRIFEGDSYPYQLSAPDPRYVGEFRGGYASSRWAPQSSRFGFTRNSGQKKHSGVDVYAPVLTAIVAGVEGQVTTRRGRAGESIGNRIWLDTNEFGQPLRLVYGHLDGFAVGDQEVARGTVIGYVGCTGNADYQGVCTIPNLCGFTAAHVHLGVIRMVDWKFVDPVTSLGLRLRYEFDERDAVCTSLDEMQSKH